MTKRRLDLVLAAYALTLTALYVCLWAHPGAAFFRELFTAHVQLYLENLTKLGALSCGASAALRATRRFAPGNPARASFGLLSGWLVLWAIGQALLAYYQCILREATPFPSLADPPFVLGGLAMIAGFGFLLRAYLSSGLAFGAQASYVALGSGVALLAGAAGWVVLTPIARAGGTPLELALNLVYPALDLLGLVPAALLMRVTLRLRGGALFWVWTLVLSGFLALAIADVLYAYLTMLDVASATPLMHIGFMLGYGLVARGFYEQYLLSS
jgi:hypothetical protein